MLRVSIKTREVGTVSIGALRLESGRVLPEVHLAYERVGPRDGPTVLVCHALTGNHIAVGTDENPGWWAGLIGSGKPIDTDRYQVVTFNVLGGCDGSTGPTSIDPETGRPYGPEFPFVTVRDMVRAEYLALRRLGIDRLHAVIGGSLGGMQALEWGVMYPEYMDLLFPIAVTPWLSDYAIAFNAIGRLAILSDPAWNGGHYDPAHPPKAGMIIARMAGMITYRSAEQFNNRFNRAERDGWGNRHDEVSFQVESYLIHHGEKLARRFDANSYLYLLKAMDTHDLGRGRGGIEEAIKRIRARVVAISYRGDLLYPPQEIAAFVRRLRANGVEASFYEVDTLYGHDGFLTEFGKWGPIVREQLEGAEPYRAPVAMGFRSAFL
ncbi:homoserine O-acetyltransferase MetX [Hydrogenibacillus schlegelii]|uniref:homoserine O-acetyltransferase MetX n=1 Tax=Hydrogenibacillus schlegelii TaxID=1484 RepID=UPI0023526D74|nr:homoserine O-acetyltransferase [Hydrogenibacillus schlegelii]